MEPRILVLDSSTDERMVLLECLRQGGYTPVGVGSIRQASRALDGYRFDLLILELILADGSGLRFCHQIRERLGAGIVIICVSRDGRLISRIAGLQLGADDFVLKPFDAEELLARIQVKLRGRGSPPGADG